MSTISLQNGDKCALSRLASLAARHPSCVTANAAEMLGWQDRVGAVEPGKFAGLAAVTGHPIADIAGLERVRFVMKDGQAARNDLASH